VKIDIDHTNFQSTALNCTIVFPTSEVCLVVMLV